MPSSSTSLHVSNTFKSIQASQPQPTLVSAGAFWGPSPPHCQTSLSSFRMEIAVLAALSKGKKPLDKQELVHLVTAQQIISSTKVSTKDINKVLYALEARGAITQGDEKHGSKPTWLCTKSKLPDASGDTAVSRPPQPKPQEVAVNTDLDVSAVLRMRLRAYQQRAVNDVGESNAIVKVKNMVAEMVADGTAAMIFAAAAKGRGVAARARVRVVEGAATAAIVAAGNAAAVVQARELAAREAENFERHHDRCVTETTDERELTREELLYLLPSWLAQPTQHLGGCPMGGVVRCPMEPFFCGETLLRLVFRCGNPPKYCVRKHTLEMLLDPGAPLEIGGQCIVLSYPRQRHELDSQCRHEHWEIITFLLEQGAAVYLKHNEDTRQAYHEQARHIEAYSYP